jgi:tetratricopeptide (TPR) repeat protein
MDAQLLALLGGSIAYEENKGDFAAARRFADRRVAETTDGDPSVAANALADRALVRLLQAEPLAALEDVARIRAVAPTDANAQSRAHTCMLWAAFYERFNTFPDSSGASATEITARGYGLADLQAPGEQWLAHVREANDPFVKRETEWIALLNRLRPARNILDMSSHYEPSKRPIQKEMLENVTPELQQVRQGAEAGGLFSIVGFADWCLADLYRRADQAGEAWNLLVRARQGYERAGDAAGMANCLLMEGDIACAPFSSPLVWNLALQDSSSEASHLPVTVEADEFRTPSRAAVAEAHQRYDEAYRLFDQAGAPRGVAAVQLRRGYVAMLADEFAGARDFAARAHETFVACGDARGAGLAKTHRVLALIGARQWTQGPQLARDIGVWGERSGSFSSTLGLGILMNRWARHWLIRRGDYERALAGCRCAQALFEALGANVNAAQSLVDQGTVYEAVGERSAALGLYELALDAHTDDLGDFYEYSYRTGRSDQDVPLG